MAENNDIEKIELKWWEKKQGITLHQKINQAKTEKQKREKKEKQKALKAEQKKSEPKEKKEKLPQKKHYPRTVYTNDALYNLNSVPEDAQKIIEDFTNIVSSTHPLNSRQQALLPKQIRILSHYLTDERNDRWLGYMNQTTTLSAYVHYYLWWNLVRLTRLFANLPSDFFKLNKDDICLDLGSGPLTVPIALLLSRPELRNVPLTWYCLDISGQSMQFGHDIFLSIAARLKCEPWNIVKVRASFGEKIKEKATLVTCANMFNETNDDYSLSAQENAKKFTEQLLYYTDLKNKGSRFLIIEPGVPKCGKFISLLRESFISKSFIPVSPCTHCLECPMNGEDKGRGGKWCNYVFTTEDVPKRLLKLSEQANLTKERAVLSFVALARSPLSNQMSNEKEELLTFRIASDPIRLPGDRTGYYACSAMGLLLVITNTPLHSGESFSVRMPKHPLNTDRKSGAYILNLD